MASAKFREMHLRGIAYRQRQRPPIQTPEKASYRAKVHTSTDQLADVGNRAKPGILIVYHTPQREGYID